ncbi:MAG TPA: polysaccharide deacetylase family protein [Gemmatimonadales bacterium]|nr:polysaccharide deacetylase family protein [Gemmatimonadales bacterium]
MFSTQPITGADLPDGHLVLTYDDGPGPNTLAVAEFLSGMGIEATFFVVGESIERLPGVPARVRALGHQLGNHTWTHFYEGLPAQLEDGGDIVDELTRTAALLDGSAASLAFRPPYGAWDPRVAATLNGAASLSVGHVGPFNWTIDCKDWAGWRDGDHPGVVAARYRAEANRTRKGIVLLHDYTADFPDIAQKNHSAELTRALVPMLMADGFRFVPLGAVPIY